MVKWLCRSHFETDLISRTTSRFSINARSSQSLQAESLNHYLKHEGLMLSKNRQCQKLHAIRSYMRWQDDVWAFDILTTANCVFLVRLRDCAEAPLKRLSNNSNNYPVLYKHKNSHRLHPGLRCQPHFSILFRRKFLKFLPFILFLPS